MRSLTARSPTARSPTPPPSSAETDVGFGNWRKTRFIPVLLALPLFVCAFAFALAKSASVGLGSSDAALPALHSKAAGKSSDVYAEPLLRGSCALRWDWPMIDQWRETTPSRARNRSTDVGVERGFVLPRSGAPSAKGLIGMRVLTVREPVRSVVVRVAHRDAMSGNVWHRFAVQFMAWVALQTARRRFGAPPDDGDAATTVTFALPCAPGERIPQGWSDLGNATCWTDEHGPLWTSRDLCVDAPRDGLLWDLAWDNAFNCSQSNMFRAWLDNYVNRSKATLLQGTQRQPLGCLIGRRRRTERFILNFNETIDMMRKVFADVRVVDVTESLCTSEIIDLVCDCKVLFGMHGAGFVNTLFAQPSAAVVELLPRNKPAYYRNINQLAGHYYIGVKTKHAMHDRHVKVDLALSESALRKALNHTMYVS